MGAVSLFAISGTSETAVSDFGCIIVCCYTERQKYTLRKASADVKLDGFVRLRVVCDFYENMSLIVTQIVVAVDNSHRVVKLQAILKSQTASRKNLKHPALVNFNAYAGRNFYAFAFFERYFHRAEKIVTGTSFCGALRQFYVLINFLGNVFFAAEFADVRIYELLF